MSGSGSDDSSWDDPPKPLSNGSNGSRAKAPGFDEVKLVPRKANTMIGLGAVKPPGSPLPSPLQGLSGAMARAPGESPPSRGAKAPHRSPTPAPETAKSAEPPAPAAADRPKPTPSPVPPPPAAIAPAAMPSAAMPSAAMPSAAMPSAAMPSAAIAPAAIAPAAIAPAAIAPAAIAPAAMPSAAPQKVAAKPAPPPEDEDSLSKAYIAPTSVPKALLPTNEDDAKVVINIPTPSASNEEVTATIDREALERQRVRDEQLDAQRRREPTQRIPRKAVQEVRREIEERTAREAALEAGVDPADVVVDSIRAIPSGPPIADEATELSPAPKSRSGRPAAASPSPEPASRTLDASVTESQLHQDSDEAEPALAASAKPPSRSMLWVAIAAVVAAGGAGAFFLLGKGDKPSDTPQAQTAQPTTKAATAKPTGETAAPPLQLTADPKTDADPNAVHLDAQAADTPSPTAEPTTQPVAPVNPNPPRLPVVKPASTYYTPSDI